MKWIGINVDNCIYLTLQKECILQVTPTYKGLSKWKFQKFPHNSLGASCKLFEFSNFFFDQYKSIRSAIADYIIMVYESVKNGTYQISTKEYFTSFEDDIKDTSFVFKLKENNTFVAAWSPDDEESLKNGSL
uniref:Uncharacterized protein n=1 Tax=Caenorhabditis japonica TaxID=281687 RepID=A0A8R1IBB4_CAEJA